MAALPAAATGVAHVDATSPWTVYHGNPLGTGADTSGVTFNPPHPAWTSPVLDGQVYGEPLEATGRVFVATENDTVYALAADSGRVLWSTHVGTPVPSGDQPCGDIGPLSASPAPRSWTPPGARSSPSPTSWWGAHPLTFCLGLNMYSGTVDLDVAVGPPGQNQADILQRTGLNLSNGNVVFGYGGNDGDCASLQRLGRLACPRAAGRPPTTRRCRSATTGPSGWAAPRPRSTRRAISGWPPGTARRRLPTTTATRSWNCPRA